MTKLEQIFADPDMVSKRSIVEMLKTLCLIIEALNEKVKKLEVLIPQGGPSGE
jgi:hypothetical protein